MEKALIRTWNRETFLTELDSGRLLPSLSALTLQLMKLSSDENCSLADIADLIEKDPSLTMRIIRLANSAFFRSRYPVTTVHSALLRIGIDQARLLALSLSLKNTFPLSKVGSADYRHYWRMSLYQGLTARFLVRKEEAEEAFTAAFTLEIGLLVFLNAFLEGEDAVEVPPWYPLSSLLDWESQTFGINHRQIGELLLTHWGFPSRLVLCQRSHEFGRSAAELPPLARICSIASELSAFICQTKTPLPELLVTMEQVFGLSPGLIADVVTLALMKVDSIAEMFEVEIDSEEDKLEVMKKAYDSLALLSQKLVEGRRFVCGMPTLAELHERPADADVRHALQAVEDEIRNPLTAVGGFARRLAKTIDPTADQAEYIRIILLETARLEQTLNGIGQVLEQ
jgi:HD-like signal output (HDOD) protein